jgi:hypothetical protein
VDGCYREVTESATLLGELVVKSRDERKGKRRYEWQAPIEGPVRPSYLSEEPEVKSETLRYVEEKEKRAQRIGSGSCHELFWSLGSPTRSAR